MITTAPSPYAAPGSVFTSAPPTGKQDTSPTYPTSKDRVELTYATSKDTRHLSL